MKRLPAKLILKDGATFSGESFGFERSQAGELVFSTGMIGYPESLTDPSYKGQILVITYPIIGNYGVPDKKFWESSRIQVSGLIVCQYIDTPSHFQNKVSLGDWLKKEKIPGIQVEDTRLLTQHLRDKGVQPAKIVFDKDIELEDPNKKNLVREVSTKKVIKENYLVDDRPQDKKKVKTIVLIDCGVKESIKRSLLKRQIRLIIAPWDYNIFSLNQKIDGIIISNGPGDPKMLNITISNIKKALNKKIPVFGICLGNQILALAAGGDTYKMKFGHRGQNQPCIDQKTKRCYITTQNHGFAIRKIPADFQPWFINANDQTNEGIIHKKYPFMSVQFHPEASPGPVDTEWLFDFFLDKLRR